MTRKTKSPNKAWSKLLDDNEELYKRARPKRAIFILDYINNYCPDLKINSYHEQGAFSGKDIKHIKEKVAVGGFFASDLDLDVANYLRLQGLNALACNAFSLPFKDDAFDLTFHSGLIVCFDNDDAFSIVEEQLRTTAKIAFVFAHNELSWIDRLASFYKRTFQGKEIFNYRRYNEGELMDMADKMGFDAEVYYFDNAITNFIGRNFSGFKETTFFSSLINRKAFFNEIVMVIRK